MQPVIVYFNDNNIDIRYVNEHILMQAFKFSVSLIKERLSVCDSIEKTVDAALQQAEAMRQSILKKAFEGDL